MYAEFTELRPFLYQFKLHDIPFTLDDILTDVEAINWREWRTVCAHRYKAHSLQNLGPALQSVTDFFLSEPFYNQMYDVVGANPYFWGRLWTADKDLFRSRTVAGVEYDMDIPGFKMSTHVDDRGAVIVGMCHFIKSDDPNQSTTFYTTENQDNPIRIPTGFGVGWLSVNTHNSWHSGHNLSTENRFSIKFGSRLYYH